MYKTIGSRSSLASVPFIPTIAFQLPVPRTLVGSVHGLNNLYYVKKTLTF